VVFKHQAVFLLAVGTAFFIHVGLQLGLLQVWIRLPAVILQVGVLGGQPLPVFFLESLFLLLHENFILNVFRRLLSLL
jgi:hypothetical protein